MMETICEKDVVCVNDNGYATTVREVNVIVNRNERNSDNILRKCELFFCMTISIREIPISIYFSIVESTRISNHYSSSTTRQHQSAGVCVYYITITKFILIPFLYEHSIYIPKALTTSSSNHLTQQYSYLPNGSTMLGFYNIQGVDLMQNPNAQQ